MDWALSIFIYVLLILGLILIALLTIYAFRHFNHGGNLKILFKDFNRKIWMTLSLGGLFLGLYFIFVGLGIYFVHQWGTQDIFFLFYRHPIEFIYGGLWLFAFLSLSIYLARMVIKYFYLTRGKDS